MHSFDDVQGHEDRVQELRRDIASGRVASAYLLVGPGGVGKRSIAALFATAALCADRQGDEPCWSCASCRAARAGRHPDLQLVERPTGGRGLIEISHVREGVLQPLALAPRMGSRRFVTIDGAESLSIVAQQALLKTLEEPPAGSCLVLVARTESGLLETVLSRCRVLRFGRLAPDSCRAVLAAHVVEGEGVDAALAVSDGSPGEAMEWLENPIFEERSILSSWILEGAATPAEMRDVLPGLSATTSAGNLGERRQRLESRFRLVLALLGVHLRWGAQVEDAPGLEYDLVPQNAERAFDLCRCWFDATRRAVEDLERMVTPELVFENWARDLPRGGIATRNGTSADNDLGVRAGPGD